MTTVIIDHGALLGILMLSQQGKKRYELISIIVACGLIDLGFIGQRFTLCNQSGITQRIREILDGALVKET